MMVTLATGAEAAAIAGWIAAGAAVAGTAVSVQSAMAQSARAKKAEALARQKAAQDRLAQNAAAAQQRAAAARRLGIQVDSSRVVAGAAGVGGGASQMVLESSFSTSAKADLAMIEANQARGELSIGGNLDNSLNSIAGDRINPLAAGITGIAQGIGTYTTINDALAPRETTITNSPSNTPGNPEFIGPTQNRPAGPYI